MTEGITYKTGIVPDIALIIDLYIDAGLSRPVELSSSGDENRWHRRLHTAARYAQYPNGPQLHLPSEQDDRRLSW